MSEVEVFNSVVNTIDKNTKRPEEFLSVQEGIAKEFRNVVKCLYDFTKEQTQRNTNALPELIIEGFDEEQIWQELELQNEGELDYLIDNVSKAIAENRKLTISFATTTPAHIQDDNILKNKEQDEKMDDDEDNISDKDITDDEDNAENTLETHRRNGKRTKGKSSIVDDKFFKLEELDDYLTMEEKKDRQTVGRKEESDDESVDLFNDLSDEDDKTLESKLLKYADFFDSPDSEDDDPSKTYHKDNDGGELNDDELLGNDSDSSKKMDVVSNKEEKESRKKSVTFNLANDSDETDSLESKNVTAIKNTEVTSSLEIRQERLKKRIQELEQAALAEKPWQLKGEVSATSRPQNSLLEEFLEFDIITRPPPVITEQTTLKLEDIIKQRIKDKAWDDVEKKFKPVETPLEYKKKLILNQEKSKESLSQIYEDEYLRQKQALFPDNNEKMEEEPKLHVEIRGMIRSVFSKLDALSNFHYTPKLVKPELKVISNVPAINMEEVAPVGMSDAALLAPEEIKAKLRGDIIGKTERTKTDMKRERRRKKMKQRARRENMEKKEKLLKAEAGVTKKYKTGKIGELSKKLSKNRNIIQMDEASLKTPKSSTAFFNQLQEQAKSHIKSKIATDSKKKQKNVLSAVKLKL